MAKVIGKIQRIPKRGKQGAQGIAGLHGRDGRDAPSIEEILKLVPRPTPGKDGTRGLQGSQGLPGERGKDGTSVTIGEVKGLVEELVGAEVAALPKPKEVATSPHKGYGGGSGSPVKYVTTITTSTYTINKNELQAGLNIFGVNYAGVCTITLPLIHDRFKDKVIVINDESGSADSNNIIIESV